MIPGLVTAGASLLGGLMSSNSAKREAHKARKAADPRRIRRRFEAAGFNPLIAFNGGYQPPGYMPSPSFGSSIANAATAFFDANAQQKQLEIQTTRLEQENKELQRRLQNQKLRPTYAGVYNGNRSATPIGGSNATVRQDNAVGVPPSGGSSVHGGGSTRDILSPDRKLKIEPYTSYPGGFEVSNTLTGGGIILPRNDGDTMDVDEALVATVFGAPQVMYNWGKRGANKFDPEHKARRAMLSGGFPIMKTVDRMIYGDPPKSETVKRPPATHGPWVSPLERAYPYLQKIGSSASRHLTKGKRVMGERRQPLFQ